MTPRCGVVTRPAGSVLPLPPSAPRPPINAKRAPLPVARRPILGSQGESHSPLPAPAAPPPHRSAPPDSTSGAAEDDLLGIGFVESEDEVLAEK